MYFNIYFSKQTKNFYFFSELEGILSENKTNIKIKIQIILVIKRIYSFE